MGHLHVDVRLIAQNEKTVRMLVDTGATYSFVSPALAEEIGAPILPTPLRVTLADGTERLCQVGLAKIILQGREAAATLVISDVVEPLLAAPTLGRLR